MGIDFVSCVYGLSIFDWGTFPTQCGMFVVLPCMTINYISMDKIYVFQNISLYLDFFTFINSEN